ncbi:hypothetical protein Emtol_4015 [Emticicia oligotrophica DSM 17448]|uniref:T9SS C-terminal target domain-containing protein n=1 Tax=Emticicia oligotrophica (strain DSM 17448 / CIP 109782 / MTCC 6937 / GPTSA100-15) TaxID=929562 RepID=A0ABN4ATE8_EMTOG|nr:3-coathanger stack domain-containing protein [Emticicia oligotrophica]AFK05140.1 hypothetical protein Emtol_4015 [Emticicia oligotrophica DSM 17448]
MNFITKLSFCFFLISHQLISQPPNISWQKVIGGSFYDKCNSIIALEDGGYLLGGQSQSSNFDFVSHKGQYDIFVIKVDKNGNIEWNKNLGGSNNENLRQIIKTSDGNYLCIGETQSNDYDVEGFIGQMDFWVIKISPEGNVIWKKCFGGEGIDEGFTAENTPDGAIVLAGSTESNLPFIENNHGYVDFLVIKINQSGEIIWNKTFGGTANETCKKIKKSKSGGYILAGNTTSSNGDISNHLGEQDIWLLKVDEDFNIIWQQTFGGLDDDFVNALIEDHEGNILATGETYSKDFDAADNHSLDGMRDYFTIKVSADGQKIWTKCHGGSNNEYAREILESMANEYLIIGESYSNDGEAPNNIGTADIWVIKLNPENGEIVWQKKFGSNGHDEPNDMVMNYENDFVFVGNTFPLDFSGDVPVHYGDDDVWLVKLSNNDCVKNLSINIDFLNGEKVFSCKDTIAGTNKIQNQDSKVVYSAGKSIILQNGFTINNGAIFEAKIEGCQ